MIYLSNKPKIDRDRDKNSMLGAFSRFPRVLEKDIDIERG